jgi:hypothetical protein
MCGFSDVRQRLDGSYWCPACGKELGKDFDERVAATHGTRSDTMRQLRKQCASQSDAAEERK